MRSAIHQLLASPLSGAEIERRSFARIDESAKAHRFDPRQWEIVRRMVHAAGDLTLIDQIRISPDAVEAGIAALRATRPVFADSKMIRAGISLERLQRASPAYCPEAISCHVADPDVAEEARRAGLPRSLFAARKARPILEGGIVLVGNSPVALLEICRLIQEEGLRPALLVAVPVGFVHVLESKQEAMESGVPHLTVVGNRGGSALAVSALHALCTLAVQQEREKDERRQECKCKST